MPSVTRISGLSIICCPFGYLKKEIKDTKGVIRIRKSKKERQHNGRKKKERQHNGRKKKERQHNGRKKNDKGQTTIYKALHRNIKIEQH